MKIPVVIQRPGTTISSRIVGYAEDTLDLYEVAALVGVPEGELIDGRIVQRRKGRRWSLITNRKFVLRRKGNSMEQKENAKLLELIQKIVSETDGKTWQEKRDALLADADDTEKGALQEFASWFDEVFGE